jgi:VWFA-related protein
MSLRTSRFWPAALCVALVAGLSAQAPPPAAPAASQQTPPTAGQQTTPTFRLAVDLVTMDVIAKDAQGRFVPDLTRDEFEVYEDGVRQEISSMTMSHGGRVTNVLEAPAAAVPEGIILPPRRVINDTSGRIFLFFVDDLHLQFQSSARVRDLFKRFSKQLVHEGDLFGIVSSGPSSISIDMTYDRKRIDEAVNKIAGSALKPTEIISHSVGSSGLTEVRHRVTVAFKTMREALTNLEKVRNRRKGLVWVSEGYDFNPFLMSRYGLLGENSPFVQNRDDLGSGDDNAARTDPQAATRMASDLSIRSELFSDADLAFELAEITRAANRANTTIYTIDPRGLTAGPDIDEEVDPREWETHVRKMQDTMRVLAEDTGGLAVVNQNDFDRALKEIDSASSDYYVLGYYSSNPDPTHRRRRIEVRVTRGDVDVHTRSEYVLGPPAPAEAPK